MPRLSVILSLALAAGLPESAPAEARSSAACERNERWLAGRLKTEQDRLQAGLKSCERLGGGVAGCQATKRLNHRRSVADARQVHQRNRRTHKC